MKLFNLEAALAGNPIITRKELPARIICDNLYDKFDPERRLVVAVKYPNYETTYTCTTDGKYLSSGAASEYDLFMAPIKKTKYVLIDDKDNIVTPTKYYDTFEEASLDNTTYNVATLTWEVCNG